MIARVATSTVAVPIAGRANAGNRGRMLRRLARSPTAIAGGAIVLLFGIVGLVAPLHTPHDPFAQDLSHSLDGPSLAHWFGTDEFGRDLLSRIMAGATATLAIAGGGVLIGLAIGVAIGVVAGYVGGWVDMALMRLIEIQMAIPGIVLAIVIISIAGVGVRNVIIAVGIFSVPGFARISRAAVLAAKAHEYVEAARCIGASGARIVVRHVLPNSLAPIIVQGSLRTATAILTAASLSFLGLGAQPPSPEWGSMLSTTRDYLQSDPHVAIFPGVAVMLVVLGFNLLGDGVRDALDTRLKL